MNTEDRIYNELEKGHHVSLGEILNAREKRVYRQLELLESEAFEGREKDRACLICFTLNIPGPVKVFDLAGSGFESGVELIDRALDKDGFIVIHREREYEATGYTAYYLVQADALSVKRLMTNIEEGSPVGRLFDIDVLMLDESLEEEGISRIRKISRADIGLDGRDCLICKDKAASCGRSRRHSVEDLQKKTIEILLKNVGHAE